MSDEILSAANVLIVEDDEIAAAVPAMALEDVCQVKVASSGEQALAWLDEFTADVILLDIKMPGLDGYDTCRALREQLPPAQQPAVIFVSSLDTLDDRLRAYEAGGNDFMLKPAEPAEIVEKVRASVALIHERRQLQSERDSVQKMAMDFLTNLGESGISLTYLRNAPSCSNSAELASMTLDAVREYGLEGALQFRLPDGIETWSSAGPASPLEESVFDNVINLDRIYQFRSRLVVNYPHVSLLSKNLPMDDEERIGRLRDYLAYIAEGCENNLRALINKREIERHVAQLQNSAVAVDNAITTLREQYRQQQMDTMNVLHKMNEQIEHQMLFFGLTEEQEEQLHVQLDKALESTMELFQQGPDFDAQLGKLQQILDAE